MEFELLATTTRGLEEVSLKEIRELTGREAWVEHYGMVGLRGGEEEVFRLNLFSRSLFRIFFLLRRLRFRKLEEIYDGTRGVKFGDYISEDQSFAVRAERQGKHDFTSLDIARVVGQAIIDSYLAERGKRLQVNLENPDIIFRAEVRGEEYWLGLDTTGERSLGKREYRIYRHPAPLKPPLAYSLVRLSGWSPQESLIDPMCGSGTILIEAARFALGIPNRIPFQFLNFRFLNLEKFDRLRNEAERPPGERLKLLGYDISPKHLEGARLNARAAGVEIEFIPGNAGEVPLNCDRIVVNPPYGLRMGTMKRVEKLYRAFAENLKKSRWKSLVIITASPSLFLRFFEEKPSRSLEVLHGDLYTHVLLFERNAR